METSREVVGARLDVSPMRSVPVARESFAK